MPFIGADWRAPGQKWVRTAEGGWRPLADLHRTLSAQIVNHIRHLTPTRSGATSVCSSGRGRRRGSRSRSRNSPASGTTSPEQREDAGLEEKQTSKARVGRSSHVQLAGAGPSQRKNCSQEKNERLWHLHFLLSMKCVSVGKSSSRESNHYSTVSDAIQKLGFFLALQDENCFPFICEVLVLIFKERYQTSGGSLQTTLLRITEAAKEIAVKKQQHSGLVLKMIESALEINEKMRKTQISGFGIRNVDSKIKSLLKMKQQLQETLVEPTGETDTTLELLSLPDDCLYLIISFLSSPKDVLNLGLTNLRLHHLAGDNQVWKELTIYHYGQLMGPQPGLSWSEIFMHQYNSSGGQLKELPSAAVKVCRVCNYVFWEFYGHPCCVTDPELQNSERLMPQKFLSLFPH